MFLWVDENFLMFFKFQYIKWPIITESDLFPEQPKITSHRYTGEGEAVFFQEFAEKKIIIKKLYNMSLNTFFFCL